ncbi:MAG: damage-inducible protein DinB [Gemmatimonadaceae bacterium]|nr:damage-inducible protein DinB [Gemmatimonadaceae bacterium]
MSPPTVVDTVRLMLAHAAWANARALAALRETPGSDPTALVQMAHVLAAEHTWLSRLQGTAPSVAVWPTITLDACDALATANAAAFAALLDDGERALQRDVTYTNSAGRTFTSRALDILLHVALHGSYHRGTTAFVTRSSGGTPVATDFIAWIRDTGRVGRPDAERTRAG